MSLYHLLKHSLVRKGIAFTVFSTINQGLNSLLIFLLSIYLTKEDFGLINLFTTLILIISVLLSLGTENYQSTVFFRQTREYFKMILNTVVIISMLVCFILCGIVLTCSFIYADILGFGIRYQLYAVVLCFMQLFYTITLLIFRCEEKVIQYGCLSLVWASLNFIFTIIFCISFKEGWIGRLNAQIISSLLLFIVSVCILFKKGYIEFKLPQKKHYTEALKFGLPLLPHNSTMWIKQGFDRYIINAFYGAAIVGIFSFAYTLSGVLLMIGRAFNLTNSVFIFKNLAEGDESKKKMFFKQIYLMIILFSTICIVGYIASRLLIIYLMPKYMDSIPYLLPLFVAALFECIYYLFVNYLFYYKKTKQLMYITFLVSIVHFLLSLLLTRHSSIYTAYIGLGSTLITSGIVVYYADRIYPIFNFNALLKRRSKHELV